MSEFVTPGHGLSGRTLTRLTRTRHLFFDLISGSWISLNYKWLIAGISSNLEVPDTPERNAVKLLLGFSDRNAGMIMSILTPVTLLLQKTRRYPAKCSP